MKKNTNRFFIATTLLLVLCFCQLSILAQTQPYGIWSAAASSTNFAYSDVRGSMVTVKWSDLQPNITDAINWNKLDNKLAANSNTNNTVLLVWVWVDGNGGAFAPPPNGVPVVPLYDCHTNAFIGNAPDYASTQFKNYFKTMISQVEQYIINQRSANNPLYQKIIAVQACLGSTGDYPSYKGDCTTATDPPVTYFYEMSQYYDQTYSGTPIHVIHNPGNNNFTQLQWILGTADPNNPSYTPPLHPWLKMGDVGHGYQLNGEKTYYTYLNPSQKIFQKLNGDYVRSRSEMATDVTSSGWWTSASDPGRQYRNMLALLASAAYFGLDMSNQLPGSPNNPNEGLMDANNSIAYSFYNNNAGTKDPSTATHGFSLLRDGLDASNLTRFTEQACGQYINATTAQRKTRFTNILNIYSRDGARLEDINAAVGSAGANRSASGINDVGDSIIEGNYERYLKQVPVDIDGDGVKDPLYATNDSYWNVIAANDPNSIFGRYAKSIRNQTTSATGTGLYFVIDDNFLQNYTGNIKITCWYLDNGTDYWQLQYKDLNNVAQKLRVDKTNTLTWKSASFVLNANIFKNRNASASASDFFLSTYNAGSNLPEEDIFSLIEIEKIGSGPLKTKGNIGTNTLQNISVLNIFPNPASDHFTISLASKKQIASISIFSESGRMVMNKKMNAQNISVSKKEIGSLPGIYYVTVIDLNNQKYTGILKITE